MVLQKNPRSYTKRRWRAVEQFLSLESGEPFEVVSAVASPERFGGFGKRGKLIPDMKYADPVSAQFSQSYFEGVIFSSGGACCNLERHVLRTLPPVPFLGHSDGISAAFCAVNIS